jgi:hypothetical protein
MAMSLLNVLIESNFQDFVLSFGNSKFWVNVMTWWLMITYFIPISLMVTMEMVKLLQGLIISKDPQGYSKTYDCHISANNTSVN